MIFFFFFEFSVLRGDRKTDAQGGGDEVLEEEKEFC